MGFCGRCSDYILIKYPRIFGLNQSTTSKLQELLQEPGRITIQLFFNGKLAYHLNEKCVAFNNRLISVKQMNFVARLAVITFSMLLLAAVKSTKSAPFALQSHRQWGGKMCVRESKLSVGWKGIFDAVRTLHVDLKTSQNQCSCYKK